MSHARGAVLALALGAASCGSNVGVVRPQWIVEITTDAPLPLLGDRLLVEVLTPDGARACSGCGLLGVDDARWPLSFGIPDDHGAALALRVQLFRADHSDAGGAPSGGLTLDAFRRLPPTGGRIREVGLALVTKCAGVVSDPKRGLTCDAETRALTMAEPLGDVSHGEGLRPGSFPAAADVACDPAPREEMVCVKGGLFIRGTSEVREVDRALPSATPERLVQLGAFALDRHELTVGELRILVDAGRVDAPRTHGVEPGCMYTEAPGPYESFPANCVSHALAARACKALEKRLPTEAEWEYAATGRSQRQPYPWGADTDACTSAVVGRGRVPGEGKIDPSSVCRPQQGAPPLPWGPRPVDESADVTDIGVRDLGGNVSEWVADRFAPYGSDCEADTAVLVHPLCDRGSDGSYVLRGGAWAAAPYLAQGVLRQHAVRENEATGFRCAVSLSDP